MAASEESAPLESGMDPLEQMLLSGAYRRVFVSVTASRLFDAAADSGSLFLGAQVGSKRIESTAQEARAHIGWRWKAELEVEAGSSDTGGSIVLAVNRKRFLGGPESVGEAVVGLDQLSDQKAHVLTLSLHPPGLPNDVVGELAVTLLFADYQQLRRAVAVADADSAAYQPPSGTSGIGQQGGFTDGEPSPATTTLATPVGPPPALQVPSSASSDWPSKRGSRPRVSSQPAWPIAPAESRGGRSEIGRNVLADGEGRSLATPVTGSADGELGFLYGSVRAEIDHEKAELARARTEAAGARLGRNMLKAMVSRLIEKRRALQAELRQMERQHATLTVQLDVLRAPGDGTDLTDPVEAQALRLLDEAEARHSQMLALRRKDHLSVVGSLQKEYLSALHTIKGNGNAPRAVARIDPERPIDPGSPGAPPPTGSPAGAPGAVAAFAAETRMIARPDGPYTASDARGGVRREAQIQGEIFNLETQIQQLKDQLLLRDDGLRDAETSLLQLRGAVATAEDARAEAEKRCEGALEARAQMKQQLAMSRKELEKRRAQAHSSVEAEEAWVGEKAKMIKAMKAAEQQHEADVRSIHAEHEKAMRAIEERLAFETAARAYDRTEAQQLSAALKDLKLTHGGDALDGVVAAHAVAAQHQPTTPSSSLAPSSKRRSKAQADEATTPGSGGVSFTGGEGSANRTSSPMRARRASMPAAMSGSPLPAARRMGSTPTSGGAAAPGSADGEAAGGFGKRAVQRSAEKAAGSSSGSGAAKASTSKAAADKSKVAAKAPVAAGKAPATKPAAKPAAGSRVKRPGAGASPLGR